MKRIWVVECLYSNGEWGPCTFTSTNYVSTRKCVAFLLKEEIQSYLVGHIPGIWTKKRFRVFEYGRLENAKKKKIYR